MAAISELCELGHDHPRRAGTTAEPVRRRQGCPGPTSPCTGTTTWTTCRVPSPLIIVVDAVFSMEGTVADLATIAELAHRHGLPGLWTSPMRWACWPRRARSFGRVASWRAWIAMGNVQQIPLPPSAGSSPRSARRTTSAQRFRSCAFSLPPAAAGRRHPRGSARRRREPDRRPRPSTWPPAWHGRAIRPSITEPRSCR